MRREDAMHFVRIFKETCGSLTAPTLSDWKDGTAVVKLRYCERVHAQFPVVFAGNAYVGKGLCLTCLSQAAPTTAESPYSQAPTLR